MNEILELPATFTAVPDEDGLIHIVTDDKRTGETIEVATLVDERDRGSWVLNRNHLPLPEHLDGAIPVLPVSQPHAQTSVAVMVEVNHDNPIISAMIAQQMLDEGHKWNRTSASLSGVGSWWFIDQELKAVDGNDHPHGEVVFDEDPEVDLSDLEDPDEKTALRLRDIVANAAHNASCRHDEVDHLRRLGWTRRQIRNAVDQA